MYIEGLLYIYGEGEKTTIAQNPSTCYEPMYPVEVSVNSLRMVIEKDVPWKDPQTLAEGLFVFAQ